MTDPTRTRALPIEALLAAAWAGVVAAVVLGVQPYLWFLFPEIYWGPGSIYKDILRRPEMDLTLAVQSVTIGIVALLTWLSVLAALLIRRPFGHRCLSASLWFYYLLIFVCWLMVRSVANLEVEMERGEDAGYSGLSLEQFGRQWDYFGIPLLSCLVVALLHVSIMRKKVYEVYGRVSDAGRMVFGDRLLAELRLIKPREAEVAPGDRIIESARSFGADKRYRRNWLGSIGIHLLILFLLIFEPPGCMERYELPEGSGSPAVPEQVAKKVEKKKEVLLLAAESPIIFERPEITESQVVEEIVKESEKEYETTSAGTPGALGEGGGTEGGWPDGLPNGRLRFIRLRYSGADWDDGMNQSTGNADRNFLQRLKKLPSVKFPVASEGESRTARELANFEKGYQPPFVYMTGSDRINIRGKDLDHIREYLQDGGLLFADAGSGRWHRSFTHFANRLFAGKKLTVISDDDPIFRAPFNFPEGIDPLFNHGGRKALGIKWKGRWVVFYHPGDVNDCWKDDAIRIPKHIRENAFQVGYNVIYYGITQYLEATRKYRQKD